jgi:hypothetical protein
VNDSQWDVLKSVLDAGTILELYQIHTPTTQEQADDRDRALDHFNACVEFYVHKYITKS